MRISYKYAVALTASIGLFMAVLDNTIVNVSLAAMEKTFNITINQIQWVITAYFLAQAAVIPAAGYFGNKFGIKRLFIISLVLFTIGSVLCGLTAFFGSAGGDKLLIIFRVFQGIGGGMLFPLATAIAFGVFPPEERGRSSALIAVPVLLAPAFGPTIGGLIVDSPLGWPGIFFVNVPVGIIAVILIARILRPESVERAPAGAVTGAAQSGGFDFVGLALSMVGVTLVAYAFTLVSDTRSGSITPQTPQGVINGWGYALVWEFFVVGSSALVAFAFYELRVARDPVLDLRLFRTYNFTVASIMTWITRAVVFGSFFLIPLFLQQFRGLTAVHTGLILIGQGLGGIVGIQAGSRLYDRIGPRALTVAGMLVLTVSTFLLAGIKSDSDWQFFLPILFLRGIGFGWSNLPLQTVALASITGRALPKASSLFQATGQVFSSIGVSIMSTLLVQRSTLHAGGDRACVRRTTTGKSCAPRRSSGAARCLHHRRYRHRRRGGCGPAITCAQPEAGDGGDGPAADEPRARAHRSLNRTVRLPHVRLASREPDIRLPKNVGSCGIIIGKEPCILVSIAHEGRAPCQQPM